MSLSSPAQAPGCGPDALRQAFLATGDAAAFLSGRTAHVDTKVTGAFQDTLAPLRPRGLALLAVGGYGRRELFPYSDVDLLVLVEGDTPPAFREALSRFLQTLWDAGLRLSQSVRGVKECCELHEQNIELNVSLLDRRFLAGDRGIFDQLESRLPRFLHGQRQNLARRLSRLTRERHARFQNTIHHLEPNIKEAPGGLRDLHLNAWLEQLSGATPGEEPAALRQARSFHGALRCFLHFKSGRDNNLLSFDSQEEMAELPFLPFNEAARGMREYFRHARAIHQKALRAMDRAEAASNSLLAGFRDWRSRLSNADFTVAAERILFKAPLQLAVDPDLAFRLFQFVARHGFRPHPDAQRRLREHLPALAAHYAQPRPVWGALREILTLPHAALALRAMHECGFLTTLFPEWESIDNYVIRDFHHRYTVDEHTLLAIQSIDELAVTKDPDRQRFRALLAELADPAVLRMALLFHDTGKAGEEAHHAAASAIEAERAALRIQVPPAERRVLRFLIEKHLELSAAMSSRDLNDPRTAREVAARVETIENLKNLTLLTYADITAVHPTAMSPWRLELLWQAYLITYNELTRELETDRIHDDTGPAERKAFLEGFPTRYLRVHEEAEIDLHLRLDAVREKQGVAVHLVREGGVYRATVLANDRPFLFASVAGTLAGFGMNILKAEAFSNRRGTVLDTFIFADPQRNLELNPVEVDRLRAMLERVLLGRMQVKELLKHRPRPARPSRQSRIEPRIAFNNDASSTATLVEIVAEDRPGLLYDLASGFSEAGCNIEIVLIDTEAHKALDVFYITRDHAKLAREALEILENRLLAACKA